MDLAGITAKVQNLSETGASPTTFDLTAAANSLAGALTDYDCPACRNKGWIVYRDETGAERTRTCGCMTKRRAYRRLRESGLSPLLESYRLSTFETPEPWQKSALAKAAQYAESPGASWFYIFGRPGTGKSHLCTGICGALLRGGMDVRYMLWRDTSRELKALANDSAAFGEAIRPYKTAEVLYIDDFLKGSTTDADIRLAFELLNSRYVARRPTLISSELSIDDVLDIDEAVGSRIYEMAKGYVIHANGKNWRLK